MRFNSIAPIAFLATLSLAACADSPLSPLGEQAASAAAKGSATTSSTARIRIFAALTVSADSPYRAAKGKAKWDSRDANSKREFEVEVENLPAGTVVEFFVNGTRIGNGTANTFGEASLELSTQLGHTVPTSVSGATVEARTAAGVVIVAGAFAAN